MNAILKSKNILKIKVKKLVFLVLTVAKHDLKNVTEAVHSKFMIEAAFYFFPGVQVIKLVVVDLSC